MGPKKATGFKRTSKYTKSPTKKPPPTATQENQRPTTELNSPPISPQASHTSPAPAQSSPEPFKFKGHPQPPVHERLYAARIFLADEDPDRCLGFDTKIAQIEELVAQIEKDKVPSDPELLRDVKVKLKVHRDWEAHRKTSPFDTGCCEAPLIAPFSTRLISADTAAALRQEREAQGLVTQMRTDHAPFSINTENDHAAFLANMREEAMTDPIEVDQDSNLLWVESRAYLWAMRSPSLIPYWMHPKNGIPIKGIAAADSRSRLHVSGISAGNRKPSRGWVPAHVATTEAKINELLGIQAPSSEEFALLQELLCPFESMDLQKLHEQDASFTEAAVLGSLSPRQKCVQEDIKTRFNSAWRSWVNTIASNGVYLIIRTPGEPEILDQPGVFYVEDGIPTPERLETLEKAQSLLDRLLANGRMDLTEQESASLDNLMQYSLPNNIVEVQREILRILEIQGANTVSDLNQISHAKVIELEKTEQERRLEWEDALKRSGGAEFCYLRPAEIKQSKHNILYLPWELTAIPQAPVQARPDLQLPPEVQKLQDDLNKDLPRNINLPNIDTGSLHFRKLLEQLVYPDLRDILTPYFALRQKVETGPLLTSVEERQYFILAAAAPPLWESWCHGLGTNITIKMPRAEQQNRTPGVMYYRNPSDKPIGEDLETYFTCKAAAINHVLSCYASQASGTEAPEYYSDLYPLCKDLQYPALKKLEEKYRAASDAEDSNSLRRDWEASFKCWIQSKKGHTVRVKLPNPRIDPDDDPSVVYYGGPLFVPSDFPAMPKDIRNRIQIIRALPVLTFPADLMAQLPPLLQHLIEAYEKENSPEAEVVLGWHLDAFMNASGSSQPTSPTLTRSNPPSPTVPALMYSVNQMTLLSPPWSREYFAQVDVDLTDFLPNIKAVESEINRLLALFGDGSPSFYLGNPNGIMTVFRQLDDHLRLTKLLEQFWPTHIYQRWHRVENYKSMSHFMGRHGHKMSAKEYEATLTACEDDFLKAHSMWLTELRATGAHIQTSLEEARQLGKVTLVFQPAITMRATETHPEPIFCVLTPEIITGPEVCTSRLVYKTVYDTPPSSTSVNYSSMLRAQLVIMETEINVLLVKRRLKEWTWDESEILLGHMRAFMFPSLFELDSNFRAIDEKARLQVLTKHELNDWYEMSRDWNKAYKSWLDGFPSEGIVIDKGDQMGRHSGVLKLKIEDPTILKPITRPKNLPHHIKSREDLMNKLVSNPSLMSEENKLELSQMLAPLFRPILREFRRLVQDHIRLTICKRSGKHPEDDALVEVTGTLAESLLLWAVIQSQKKCTIQILEPVPGKSKIQCVDSLGAVMFSAPEAEENVFPQQLFDQLCPPFLDGTMILFHDLAFRIRIGTAQSQEDFEFLTQNIPDITKTDPHELRTRVVKLLISSKEQEAFKSQIQKELSDTITKLFWKTFMSLHLDQDEKIWKIIGNPIIPHHSPVLVARRLPGTLRLAPPPLVAPNEIEVKALEIELNNLLIGDKTSTINREQQLKLNYILRALLPPRLRFLKNRIDELDRQYLAKDGLNLRDSLELVDVQDQFEPQFEHWKSSISDLGIVLDHWLSTPVAIAEACSRARQWKEITTKSNVSTHSGNMGNQIGDTNVKQCHDIYAVLREFVCSGCRDPSYFGDRLQLNAVPQEIRDQISQIATQTKVVSTSTASDDKTSKAMLLQTMKDQLIKLYVKWLVHELTPTQRQRLFSQVRASQVEEIDFAPKAERRGVQRAVIELALNLLATNQEQHRPKDRFRMIALPSDIKLPEKEVPLCLPLKPDERPLEQDPLEYTKKMLAFRRWKDYDYGIARLRLDQSGSLPAPENCTGPSSIATVEDVHAAARIRLKELASVQKRLIEAVKTAPRPLLQQLLLLVDIGLNYDKEYHALLDSERLTTDAIDLLEELAGQSWDDERQEYGGLIPGIDNTPDDLSRLEEFELDMAEMLELPPWEPAPYPDAMNEDSFEHFAQIEYDPTIPSTIGMTGEELRQAIGDRRLAKSDGKAGTPHLWDLRAVLKYLRAMESARRIHLDELSNGDVLVTRIPLGGHPENKYVVSRAAAASSPGVRYDEEGKLEVRYDISGIVGPPILQPNKFHHLQKVAFRLGRDLKKNALVLAGEDPNPDDRVEGQLDARAAAEAEMDNILPSDRSGEPIESSDSPPRNITIQRMAQDLHKIAPDLAVEAGFQIKSGADISERQAATLLQMQILEEASNNWEFKFPNQEHVWNFASDRVETTTRMVRGRSVQGRPRFTQYFHMRRFPPCCQSEERKALIKESGPIVQEKLEPVIHSATDTDPRAHTEQKVRHIRGREPYFSLGESAYERAFLSWRMEQELKDVPEFQIPKRRRSWWQFRKDKDDGENSVRRERYPLPKIPDHWVPDSVSIAEKRAHVLELAKKTPAFPNPDILEYYHTPAEIEQIKLRRQWEDFHIKRGVATEAVERYTGKNFNSLTNEEWQKVCQELEINSAKGLFIDDEKIEKGGEGEGKMKRKQSRGHKNMALREGLNGDSKRTRVV